MKFYLYSGLACLLILLAGCMGGEHKPLGVEICLTDGTNPDGFELFLGDSAMACTGKAGQWNLSQVTRSESGFYKLTSIINGGQVMTPIYIPEKYTELKLEAEVVDGCFLLVKNDADCRALSMYTNLQGVMDRRLWTEVKTEAEAKTLLSGYGSLVDEACNAGGNVSDVVRHYISLWAYVKCYNNITDVPQVLGVNPSEISLKPSDILPPANDVLDDALAVDVPFVGYVIISNLNKYQTIDEKLGALYNIYKVSVLREKAIQYLLNNYLTNFDYANHYTEGLDELKKLTAKYNLPDSYIEKFQSHTSASKGASFPEGIVLQDKDGQEMDFSSLKGKYVYVDFWASWCKPCCKEVPYLQKLEESLDNPDVAFLSISIDSSRESWLKRMEELNMHGNQWLDAEGRICDAFGITGIPHFAIYDKEGKLMVFNAARPSSGSELKDYLESLK